MAQTDCSRDRLSDKSCDMLKRSGKDLVSELDSNGAMCNSACVLALSGGAVRSVRLIVSLARRDKDHRCHFPRDETDIGHSTGRARKSMRPTA